MKILHVVPTYLPARRYGGPIASVHGLCRALTQRGHEVHVFTTNVDGPCDSAVPLEQAVDLEGVRVWYFASKILRRIYWSPGMKRKLLSGIGDFDVLHAHSVYLWPPWAACRLAIKNRIPALLSPRGMLVRDLIRRKNAWIKKLWLRCMDGPSLKKISGIHVTSENEAGEIRRLGLRVNRIFCVPNGVDLEEAGRAGARGPDVADGSGRPEGMPYFLFLGRLNWKKGLDRLIPAFRFVSGARLVIAGNDEEGYRAHLERLIKRYGVCEKISFFGYADGEAKRGLFASAAAFVLPSYSENFGNAVLEAMAAGCPAVVTPEVGLAETVKKSGAGIVVEGRPDILGKELSRLVSEPDQRREMGLRARKAAEAFSWDRIAERMEAVYREVSSTGRSG